MNYTQEFINEQNIKNLNAKVDELQSFIVDKLAELESRIDELEDEDACFYRQDPDDELSAWIKQQDNKAKAEDALKGKIPVSLEFDTTGFSNEQCEHLIAIHQHYRRRPGQVGFF